MVSLIKDFKLGRTYTILSNDSKKPIIGTRIYILKNNETEMEYVEIAISERKKVDSISKILGQDAYANDSHLQVTLNDETFVGGRKRKSCHRRSNCRKSKKRRKTQKNT